MKIMIVEDDGISRKVMVNKLSEIGTCIEAKSGKEALAQFKKAATQKKPFDLILLDISMPDMDGIQVLNHIRKKEKSLNIPKSEQIRIIMATASMRKSSIEKCIRLGCNSYISKPFHIKKVFEEMERLGFKIPEKLKHSDKEETSYTDLVGQIIKQFNTGKIELPVLPHMVKEIQAVVNGPTPSIEELSAIIQKDAVVSGKLIRAANSPIYKGVETVTTLGAALIRLGIKNTLSAVTTITSKNLFDSDNKLLKVLLNKIWLHSLACACCGKFIAEELNDPSQDDVFLSGIIHDIGKVLLLKAIVDISPDESLSNKDLLSAIQDVHTVFGAVLIKKWGFSLAHIRGVELHHWDRYPDDTETGLLIVHIANIMVTRIGIGSFDSVSEPAQDEEMSPPFLAVLEQLNLKPDQVESIQKRVKSMMDKIPSSF